MISERKGGLAAEVSGKGKKKRPAVICEPLEDEATTYSSTIEGSTIGATGLNFSVRNGKRWTPVL